MLTITNLSVNYKEKQILTDINLKVKSNEIVSIQGQNGSGKTSLIRCISTLLSPSSGNIMLYEIDYNVKTLKKIRKRISVLLDGTHSLYDNLTVNQNIKYYSKLYNINNDKINLLKDVFGLNKYQNELFCKLSNGNRQKTALIIGIAKDSNLLILDEPDIGLDQNSNEVLANILLDEKKNKTIIMTSHNLDLISKVSDSNYIIQEKKLLLI